MQAPERRDLLGLIGPLYRSLRRIEDRCAQDGGLTMWQYAVLSVASRHEGLSQAEIADRLGYSRNRIIHDLDVLEERGLAERRTGADRRRYLIHVTGPGRDTAAQVRDAIWSAEDALLSHVPAESRFSLQRLLEDVASTSAAREDPPPRSPRSDRD